MSFSQEVAQFFALSNAQSRQFEAALNAFEQQIQLAEENTPEGSNQSYQKFTQLIAEFGFDENNVEALMSHLYAIAQYRPLVRTLIPSYYQAGGDRNRFEELYHEILIDERI